jgi:hypothetical protein
MSPDTAELAAPDARADTAPDDDHARRHDPDARTHVRASDIEPYIGLRYLSKLFRFMAIILVLLLLAEVITGLVKQGRTAIPTLLGEMSRLIVLAGLLWGTGDLAILLIDVGHDVRAARILLGRQVAHQGLDQPPAAPPPIPERQPESPHRRSTEITTR